MKSDLKSGLEDIYNKYHNPGYLRLDPLEFVHGLSGRENMEIGGIICSALAYGRIEQIRKSISRVFAITGADLKKFSKEVTFLEKKKLFSSFKHRFNTGTDIAVLLECSSRAIEEKG
jgi:hypothetical protein